MSTESRAPVASSRALPRGGSNVPAYVMIAVSVVLGGAVVATDQRELVGLFAVLLMLSLMFSKVPVAFALALSGLLGLLSLHGFPALANAASSVPYSSIASWSLSVLPTFILMGLLLHASGVTGELFVAAKTYLGWLPGGLAVATNTAGAGFAAVSGSTIATTHALARVAVPEMIRAGYSPRLALSSVVSAGLPGQLIPPSTFLVIYAGIASVPVGAQLLAGVLPGVAISVVFSALFVAMAIFQPALAGGRRPGRDGTRRPLSEYTGVLLKVWPVPVLAFLVVGGMLSGVLTATEAGAAGAFGALVICLVRQRRDAPVGKVLGAAADTAVSVGSIFLLIVGAHIFSNLMTVSGISALFTGWVVNAGLGPFEFMLVVALAYLIMGMFMDPLSMLLLTVPMIMPILPTLGISPIVFGVFAVVMAELAIITPPVGILSFILHKIVQDPRVHVSSPFSLGQVFGAVLLALPVAFLMAALILLFPEMSLWLPSLAE